MKNSSKISASMSSAMGSHAKTLSLLACNFQRDAREYVHLNANVKGSPNMTCKSFAAGVSESWGHQIHKGTARRWLHNLGFKQKISGKGVYFDSHE